MEQTIIETDDSERLEEETKSEEEETELEKDGDIESPTEDLEQNDLDIDGDQGSTDDLDSINSLAKSSDDKVIELRNKLNLLGFPTNDEPESNYGKNTEEQVGRFQEYYQLDAARDLDTVLDQLDFILNTPFKQGGKHDNVVELKKNLVTLGFGNFKFNKNYGSSTAKVVEELQDYYGLVVNGIADPPTLDKIQEVLNSPLREGQVNKDVIQLKKDLVTLGFGDFSFNQNYFSGTTKIVKEFQAFYELRVNGIVDSRTQDKIDELINTPMQRGDYRKDVIILKEKLAKLGFVVSSNPTPQYGSATERNVKEFQEYYGLNDITGIADSKTIEKLDELLNTSLQYGGRHKDVIQLKKDLVVLGFGDFNFNQNYLGKTVEKVEEFQAYYGLRVNGIADSRTLQEINKILSSYLQEGQVHDDVIELKKNLVTLGFGNFTFNRNYGSTTAATVREFQAFYDLRVNGIVDLPTQEMLNKLISTPMQRGDYRKDAIILKEKLAKLGFVVSSNPTPQYGSSTERNVKEFQKYYGLANVTGKADQDTLKKLDELLSTPLQRGGRDSSVIDLKKDLVALGFGSFNFNQNYGSSTEASVKEFQSYYGLKVNGIADPPTLNEMLNVLNSPFREGQVHDDVIQLKKDLNKLGFGNFSYNKNYFSTTARVVGEFQEYYGLKVNQIADQRTLDKIQEVLNSPLRKGQKNDSVIKLKKDLNSLGFGNFNFNNNFGSTTESVVKQFQKSYGLVVNGIADEVTLRKLQEEVNKKVVKIFLDPGHGGKDPGASAYGLLEKNVVLDIALKTADILTTQYIGVDVKLSRKTDKFIELVDRAKMANNWGADYFVSFHTNAYNGSANGFESYIFNGGVSSTTKQKQKDIHTYLINRIGTNDRGMKQANFSVLRNTNMPALLVEYLFIDNATENTLLKDKSYRNWLGQITAEAIAQSYGLKKK
nr:peptidoglycan-binding protein [Amphibacillus sp. MSJ-3]